MMTDPTEGPTVQPLTIPLALVVSLALPDATPGAPALAPAPDPPVPADSAAPALSQPGIRPDGSEIAFVAGGDIWVVPAGGGEARLVVANPANEARPLYSPDGGRLAFVSDRAGSDDVYVLDLASGAVTRVTWSDGAESLDAWSPDGMWLYFTSAVGDVGGMTDVFRVPAAGGSPVPVSASEYQPEYFAAVSPDGATVAVNGRARMGFSQWWRHGHSHIDESEIWLVRPEEDGAPSYRRLTAEGEKSLWPMWDADGSTVLFMSDRSGAENLWRQPVSGGDARPVTRFDRGRVLWPTITRDGGTVAFERDFGIWTADVASGRAAAVPVKLGGEVRRPARETRRLSSDFSDMALSPDGAKLAFVARGDVFAVSAEKGGAARQVTRTVAPEADLVWAPDSRRLAYTSRRSGTMQTYVYDFVTGRERAVSMEGTDHALPVFSPDGDRVAFVRDGSQLVLAEVGGGGERVLARAQLWSPPFGAQRALAWSPDGRWLAFLAADAHMFTNVYVVPADGSAEARPVSWLANSNARSLAWSPDGKALYFDTQQRTEDGRIARVDLLPRVPVFREAKFDSLFRPEEPASGGGDGARTGKDPKAVSASPVEIDFDGIAGRLALLPLGLSAGSIAISPDGETLVFVGEAEGQQNLYAWSLDAVTDGPRVARQLTSSPGNKGLPWFGKDGKTVYFLDRGRARAVTLEGGKERSIDATAELTTDFHADKMEVFDEAWSYMRDHFYDADMHGADWNAVREAWAPRVVAAETAAGLERLMNLMLGELNASHLGHSEPSEGHAETGRLGIRWDPEALADGRFVVARALARGPAAVAGIAPGARILAVAGSPLGPDVAVDRLLENTVGDRVALTVADGQGRNAREVTVQPVSTSEEGALAYRAWVEGRRAFVDSISGGRLGYVHMPDMGWGSLQQLLVDLDAANFAKEGVVVDVRANRGGFVNAYALDVFARRGYITMEMRGYPTVPARSMLGQRSLELPTVLVTDMNALSDAEDFTEGYRTLGLGPVVGEPTAGWIIYTWSARLVDGSTLRMPRTRIRAHDGQVMELNPRPVDVPVSRPLGETHSGHDRQLEAAVSTLLDRIGAG